MGTDNLHHKKRAMKGGQLKRSPVSKKYALRYLIVCEGEKTEPIYFEDLRKAKRLRTANVRVSGECGSDPMSVVNHAVKLYEEEKDGAPYDRVFCVIDKDKHANYNQALARIRELGGVYSAVCSIPCFEYWLLLHFECYTKPFFAAGKRSVGGAVEKELRRYIKDYKKGGKGLWLELEKLLPVAIENSRRILALAEADGNHNPSTKVHVLVEELLEMAS